MCTELMVENLQKTIEVLMLSVPDRCYDEVKTDLMEKGLSILHRNENYVFVTLRNQKFRSIKTYKNRVFNNSVIFDEESPEVIRSAESDKDDQEEIKKMLSILVYAYNKFGSSQRRLIRTAIILYHSTGKVNWRKVIKTIGVTERRGRRILASIRKRLQNIKMMEGINGVQRMPGANGLFELLR